MSNRSACLITAAVLMVSGLFASSAMAATPVADPFLWLEEVESPRALAWVEAQNRRSLGYLEADPRYAAFNAQARAIVEAQDRLAVPQFIGQQVYSFWQDATHVRGLWRRTSLDSYRTAEPVWETVLDLDDLSRREGTNPVWKGATCRPPLYDRCLVHLSDGGKDAVEIREFDLVALQFVQGGFALSESKTTLDWLDDDTIALSRDFGAGTLSDSGYGFIVKTLNRGQTLDQARELYRSSSSDVGARPIILHDGEDRQLLIINRWIDFFHSDYLLMTPAGLKPLPLPQQSSIEGYVAGRLVVQLQEAWRGAPAGAVISLDPELASQTPDQVQPQILFQPNPRQSVGQVATTRNRVVIAAYDTVRGRLMSFAATPEGWTRTDIAVPDNSGLQLVSASDQQDQIFYAVESYLTPPTLFLADTAGGGTQALHSEPARFETAGLVTEQFEAVSRDGTRVPYFVVRPKGLVFDGKAPTLLYAYGGFQISMEPAYGPVTGKLWLERGGVFVVANIRGGGEFGPAWHQAGLKTQRQRIYDDFQAVALDLIERKITTPRHLGIMGGSNGGLLMGVQFNQRPDLWNAVVIQVPLLDMLRYDQLLAGASWVGEYGKPSDPVEGEFLQTISPYQNLKSGVAYPEPLIVTSTKDDRVHPGHARKFAARLEQLGRPFLYYENTDGGHAAAANQRERARRTSLEMIYLSQKLMD